MKDFVFVVILILFPTWCSKSVTKVGDTEDVKYDIVQESIEEIGPAQENIEFEVKQTGESAYETKEKMEMEEIETLQEAEEHISIELTEAESKTEIEELQEDEYETKDLMIEMEKIETLQEVEEHIQIELSEEESTIEIEEAKQDDYEINDQIEIDQIEDLQEPEEHDLVELVTDITEGEYMVENPCQPNPCMTPPDSYCALDGKTLITYDQVGECIANGDQAICVYYQNQTDCSLSGKVCKEGECKEILKQCPPDMVLIQAPDGHYFCMDKYECSRADATETSQGTSPIAVSKKGVLPWHVSFMNKDVLNEFTQGCELAGKRMCTKDEWFEACNGPEDTLYFFGNQWDSQICNNVDAFCDDYCLENNIDPCNTAENCGYQYYCFHVTPTGAFPNCTNQYGLFDINGNVWEVVPVDTPRGYEVRGGAFNCGNPSVRLKCTFNAEWDLLYAGFRCCKDPE